MPSTDDRARLEPYFPNSTFGVEIFGVDRERLADLDLPAEDSEAAAARAYSFRWSSMSSRKGRSFLVFSRLSLSVMSCRLPKGYIVTSLLQIVALNFSPIALYS